MAHYPVKAEKVLADFEMACEKDLATVKTLARIGPILGLMGTAYRLENGEIIYIPE